MTYFGRKKTNMLGLGILFVCFAGIALSSLVQNKQIFEMLLYTLRAINGCGTMLVVISSYSIFLTLNPT